MPQNSLKVIIEEIGPPISIYRSSVASHGFFGANCRKRHAAHVTFGYTRVDGVLRHLIPKNKLLMST